jgi:hypothetical protein
MHNAAGQKSGLQKLALLLATHFHATPKQAKEPGAPKLKSNLALKTHIKLLKKVAINKNDKLTR